MDILDFILDCIIQLISTRTFLLILLILVAGIALYKVFWG